MDVPQSNSNGDDNEEGISLENVSILDMCKSIQKAVVNATKAANAIPLANFGLYETYPAFSKVINFEKKTITTLINSFFKHENLPKRVTEKFTDEEKLNAVIDFNDFILDRVGNVLDDFEGLKKRDQELIIATLNVTQEESGPQNKINVASWNQKVRNNQTAAHSAIGSRNIAKPQLKFKNPVDNSHKIFQPILKFKHNSITPHSILPQYDDQGNLIFPNPYEQEILKFKIDSEMFKRVKPIKPNDVDATPLIHVNTLDELQLLHKRLMTVKQFAVDLEYHNYRSFLGFTCLMQISTRTEDYIVDTLELRDELHILNEPFTDPKILKVFHGSDWDIQWLQKDLGIYVVNMFDTCQAARLLKLPQYSLFFLVKHYCGKTLDKQYQLADWRIRPLTPEMLAYAREDSRNLLYIYDLMRNELIDSGNLQFNLLEKAHEKSNELCLKVYEKPKVEENSHMFLLQRSRVSLNKRQMFALKQLYFWRDRLAREEDESLVYVLPNHMMLKIAEVLPREMQGILSCCNPIPVMVRRNLADLHMMILKARELPLDDEEEENKNVVQLTRKMNHSLDITSTMDFLDDEHVNVEDQNQECLLGDDDDDVNGSNRHQVYLKRTTDHQTTDNSLLNFLSQKDEQDPFVLDTVAAYESPFAKYLKYVEKKQKLKQQQKAEKKEPEVDSKVKQPEVVIKAQTLITHSKKKARTEAEYDKLMEDKPLKEMMKVDVGEHHQDSKKEEISEEALESIDRLLIDAQKDSESKSMELEEEPEEDFGDNKLDYDIFLSKGTSNKGDYFDPTKDYLQQKQKNKSFKSRTKRRKDMAVSSASIAKKTKR